MKKELELTTEDKIKERLAELEDIKSKTIEQLKIQQELAIKPIEAVIAELTALLPIEIKKEGGEEEKKDA